MALTQCVSMDILEIEELPVFLSKIFLDLRSSATADSKDKLVTLFLDKPTIVFRETQILMSRHITRLCYFLMKRSASKSFDAIVKDKEILKYLDNSNDSTLLPAA